MSDTKTESGREKPDMQHLTKPRGKGYSLRMVTPEVLIGLENPWTGKPFGREIKLGLKTRSHAEALRRRDMYVGQIRQLEAEALAGSKGIMDLTPESAAEWRQMRAEAADPRDIDFALTDKLERAERAGAGPEARAFGKMVFKGAMPITQAMELYLEERSGGNPFGYDPLATTTALNVRSSVRHLIETMEGENLTLHDVTADVVHRFRTEYLPLVAKVKPQTVEKHTTLLRGLWTWAITDKKLLRNKRGGAVPNPWVAEEKGTSKRKATSRASGKPKRMLFTPQEATLLLRAQEGWGSKKGDLIRLALATGCRVNEIASLKLCHVNQDGSGFTIPAGKSGNARRLIPLVGDAQRLAAQRLKAAREDQAGELAEAEMRFFPEWPVRKKSGKAAAASQWFTRFRREVLGPESDTRLALHSFRHTWAIMCSATSLVGLRDIAGG